MPHHSEASNRAAALQAWVRALDAIRIIDERPEATLPLLVEEMAQIHGDKLALIDDHTRLTYADLAARANFYAHWALAQGLGIDDAVCLLMPNCPDYVAIWFGITQTGCTVALLNTNLSGDALLHCIGAAAPAHVIVAAAMCDKIAAIAPQLGVSIRCWVHGETDAGGFARIDTAIARHRATSLDLPPPRRPGARDRALLIYTSGTTGLPKAANVSHGRLVEWSCWFAAMMDVQPADRLYDCLPMYHSTGGVVAIGALLVRGGSVLIRTRFSASRFWDDVADGDCTIVQYIGELCRYLLRSPPHPREALHRLRLCCGNGMRGDVWQPFQRRFVIPHILEFYAATEGSVSLYNCEEKPGAIGRVPPFLAHRFPVALIRCDVDTGEPLRDAQGFCIRCAPDEPGEALGRIVTAAATPARQFDGYTDAAAAARKVLTDVFAPGDRWFRTGDLMRKDAAGYYYFVDRMGDTFRWKGENVSTTEVAAVIAACPGVTEAVVYGVAVPGNEGRAGMAAITTGPGFDLDRLRQHLAANLPDYARPVFVRFCASLDITGTFKLVKRQLAREGFSSAAAPDPVWFDDRARGAFVACDDALRGMIAAGTIQKL
jgi:fatty-acyl-CoA synthase